MILNPKVMNLIYIWFQYAPKNRYGDDWQQHLSIIFFLKKFYKNNYILIYKQYIILELNKFKVSDKK
jgi:hypothetical protein